MSTDPVVEKVRREIDLAEKLFAIYKLSLTEEGCKVEPSELYLGPHRRAWRAVAQSAIMMLEDK